MGIYIKEYLQAIKRIMLCVGFMLGIYSGIPTAVAASGGTSAYQVQAIPFQWDDATTGTKQTTETLIPIGFNFQYYGVTYSSLAIGDEGYLTMGKYEPFYNPYVNAQTTPIMPYYDGIISSYPTSPGGGVYTKLEGSAPNRQFTVSWIDSIYVEVLNDCGDVCTTFYFGKVSFQVTLFEGSNDIVFRYLDVTASDEASAGFTNHDNGVTARVGVANTGLHEGTWYSQGGQPSINPGTALRFFMGSPANLSPIADAGPDLVVNQSDIGTLYGGGSSDSDGTIASYLWVQDFSQSSGKILPLTNANTAIASFTAPRIPLDTALLAVKLTVTDHQGAYSTDRANVTIRNVDINRPPIANAGADQTVNEGDSSWVTLIGSGVDPDGFAVTNAWTQIAGPTVSYINPNDVTAQRITFYAPTVPADTVLTFQFTVTDIRGATGTDTVNITVRNAPNKPPLANAGLDTTVTQKTPVTLNGSGSTDSDGNIVSYRWQQVEGKAVTLNNASSAILTFTTPSTNRMIPLTFELTVTDNNGATAKDQVVVIVVKR